MSTQRPEGQPPPPSQPTLQFGALEEPGSETELQAKGRGGRGPEPVGCSYPQAGSLDSDPCSSRSPPPPPHLTSRAPGRALPPPGRSEARILTPPQDPNFPECPRPLSTPDLPGLPTSPRAPNFPECPRPPRTLNLPARPQLSPPHRRRTRLPARPRPLRAPLTSRRAQACFHLLWPRGRSAVAGRADSEGRCRRGDQSPAHSRNPRRPPPVPGRAVTWVALRSAVAVPVAVAASSLLRHGAPMTRPESRSALFLGFAPAGAPASPALGPDR